MINESLYMYKSGKHSMLWKFKENSLDAIRLLAASEVAIEHTLEFMLDERPDNLLFEILELFPGVPIFFFISGYLISKAYERSPNNLEYAKNRILRLYPALIVCIAVNIMMVGATGYFSISEASNSDIALLFFGKTTFFQFYNPDFMRAFGDGVLNGSLWTICIELQFYILTPLLYKASGNNREIKKIFLISLIPIFLVANRSLYLLAPEFNDEVWWKLYRVSFAPWFYMFLTGILFQRNFDYISSFIEKIPFVPMLLLYIGVALVLNRHGFQVGNEISPLLFVILIPVVFRAAYFLPNKINSLMQGNDISYGVYIWHMPIVNQMLYLGYSGHIWQSLLALTLSVFVAVLSWRYIEKPALKKKKISLNTRIQDEKKLPGIVVISALTGQGNRATK
jgi:peptidoglycan/LPS O-acetylase OafA/YrhL